MDSGDFEELAVPLFGSLYSTARWLTGNREEAEDLVQEVYAKALRGFASYQQGTHFRAWIFRILRNTFLTSRSGLAAKAERFAESEDEDGVDIAATIVTPESIALLRADEQALEAALFKLPVPLREVIVLCHLEEMSYREMAEALALPLGTVMSRLFRARKTLRKLLQEGRT
jgi:RNA polymerase sigma-70 factor (ECF subfamily)